MSHYKVIYNKHLKQNVSKNKQKIITTSPFGITRITSFNNPKVRIQSEIFLGKFNKNFKHKKQTKRMR